MRDLAVEHEKTNIMADSIISCHVGITVACRHIHKR